MAVFFNRVILIKNCSSKDFDQVTKKNNSQEKTLAQFRGQTLNNGNLFAKRFGFF